MGYYDLVRVSVVGSPGVGPITLGGAVPGYIDFVDAGVQDGETVSYGVIDGVKQEVGHGVYTAATSTLTRSVQASTNDNALINLTSSAIVYLALTAGDMSLM